PLSFGSAAATELALGVRTASTDQEAQGQGPSWGVRRRSSSLPHAGPLLEMELPDQVDLHVAVEALAFGRCPRISCRRPEVAVGKGQTGAHAAVAPAVEEVREPGDGAKHQVTSEESVAEQLQVQKMGHAGGAGILEALRLAANEEALSKSGTDPDAGGV